MTTPHERTRALLHTREFLDELCDSQQTPDVPDTVRLSARRLLRHYPEARHLDEAAVAWPMHWERIFPGPRQPPSYMDLVMLMQKHGLVFASKGPVPEAPPGCDGCDANG